MAFSPKLLSFILLASLFIISTHARDSQFFSKFTRHPDPITTTTTTNPAAEFYNPATTTTNENDEFSTLNKQNEEEVHPSFTPETSGGAGYGLYGHETGLFPPSTTATTTNTNNNNNNAFETKNYVPELQGLSEFSKFDNRNNDKSYYYDGREYKRNGEEGVGYYGGVEKQGMSDTRYLENGRYFYDVNAEKNNNYNNYKGGNYNNYGANYMPYNTNYGGNYKENEYYGGNNNEFYNRDGNNFNGNAMQGGYQHNQKTVNDEFEFDP